MTLDRTPSFKEHSLKTKKKVCARNNIMRKLTDSTWGTDPTTLRTSALGLCLSSAEYSAPVWNSFAPVKLVELPELFQTV